jgi:hypothetical protein
MFHISTSHLSTPPHNNLTPLNTISSGSSYGERLFFVNPVEAMSMSIGWKNRPKYEPKSGVLRYTCPVKHSKSTHNIVFQEKLATGGSPPPLGTGAASSVARV